VTNIDAFATSLLEESKRFLEKALVADGDAESAYLHAAMMLAFCALEAHINAVAAEFSCRDDLSLNDLSILNEQEIRFEDGEFVLKGLKIFRLEDRVLFLYKKFSGKKFDKKAQWWAELKSALHLRNQLTHPKDIPCITKISVSRAIMAVIEAIYALYKAIYKK
jgi:hypothetical protein